MDMLTNTEKKSSINLHHLFVTIINITIIIITASKDHVVVINLHHHIEVVKPRKGAGGVGQLVFSVVRLP